MRYNYVVDGEAGAGFDGSHARSSLAGVLDQADGLLPHVIGQTVQVLAESQSVLEVGLKVARLLIAEPKKESCREAHILLFPIGIIIMYAQPHISYRTTHLDYAAARFCRCG